MGKHSSYSIKFDGNIDLIKKAVETVKEIIKPETIFNIVDDTKLESEKMLNIEDEYTLVWVEDISEKLALRLSNDFSELNFVIKGTVDTSESAGEYMDFIIEYNDGKLIEKSSCWYVLMYADEFEDYDEFCEEFCDDDGEPLYTKKQFKKFQDGDWYILDSGDGDVVENVPIDDIREIK